MLATWINSLVLRRVLLHYGYESSFTSSNGMRETFTHATRKSVSIPTSGSMGKRQVYETVIPRIGIMEDEFEHTYELYRVDPNSNT